MLRQHSFFLVSLVTWLYLQKKPACGLITHIFILFHQIKDVDLISVSMENSLATIGGLCCGTDHLLLTIRCGVFTKILACIPVVAALQQLFRPFHSQCTQGARDFSCSCTVSSFRQCCLWCCSIELLFQELFW